MASCRFGTSDDHPQKGRCEVLTKSKALVLLSPALCICLEARVSRAQAQTLGTRRSIALWLDAADKTSIAPDEAGKVRQWLDRSGKDHHAEQEAADRRPVYVAGAVAGGPLLRFDGKRQYLSFRGIPLKDFAAFVVFRPSDSRAVLLGDSANRDWVRIEEGRIKAKWSNVPTTFSTPKFAVKAKQLVGFERRGSAVVIRRNGALAAKSVKSELFTPEHIGHKSTGGVTENFYAGDIAEIIVYSRALADAERRQVEQYLLAKWQVEAMAEEPADPDLASMISHGPMLGAVSENAAAIWLRTVEPAAVRLTLRHAKAKDVRLPDLTLKTDASKDNTCVARFDGLKPDTQYEYVVSVGPSTHRASFSTFGPSMKQRVVRLVYGYGYAPGNRMRNGESIFLKMAERKGDFVLFIGDFPYTRAGRRVEIHEQNKVIRNNEGFTPLTSGTPTGAVWDDHDFGPNDCDGTHPHADEALVAFKEYWANPSYGLPNSKGIYSTFAVGDVQVFLLDGRYHARQASQSPTMLGRTQFEWLCGGLKASSARYKLLVSGTPFARVKRDCWGGTFYRAEREALFKFIADNSITGVLAISGDIHRCDIHKLPIGHGRFMYDFTAGALARVHRFPPKDWPDCMLYSYGNHERNMFGEIDFHPASDREVAITFRSFSGAAGLSHRFRLAPEDLGL